MASVENERESKRESCPCRASDDVPVSSPLWDVDCFSLSARPQVRCRERRRCDYQSSALDVLDEKRILDDRHQTVQLIAATPVRNSHTNHARVLVKSNDASNCQQTQCWWSWQPMTRDWQDTRLLLGNKRHCGRSKASRRSKGPILWG